MEKKQRIDKDPVVISNWSESCPIIKVSDLGWTDDLKNDVIADDPKDVFDRYWQHAFSIIFYYVDDGNFYELFMESWPHKFWMIEKNPNWDGRYVSEQIEWEEHREGKVLFTFDDDTDLWNTLKVGGKPIGEVLERSLIAEVNL